MGTGSINSKKRYLTSLKEKHRELDNEVTMLYSKHISDDIIKPLKQKKLYLKQQIMELTTEIKEMI